MCLNMPARVSVVVVDAGTCHSQGILERPDAGTCHSQDRGERERRPAFTLFSPKCNKSYIARIIVGVC